MTKAKISEATNTKKALLCKELYFGHVTFSLISSYEAFTKSRTLFIPIWRLAREVGLEPTAYGFGDRRSTS